MNQSDSLDELLIQGNSDWRHLNKGNQQYLLVISKKQFFQKKLFFVVLSSRTVPLSKKYMQAFAINYMT